MNSPATSRTASGPDSTADAAAVAVPAARPSYRVIVVLPCYNEEANIGPLLDRIDDHLTDSFIRYQVVVVNDGSRDRSAEILEEYSRKQPVEVYHHKVNQGLGATIRDGLAFAAKMAGDKDIVITMDADETHTPGLILRMVRMIREGYDVVIASRYQRGAMVLGLTLHRRFISWASSWLMRVMFPTPGVRDYTCGYRAYRADVLKAAMDKYGDRFVDQEGFQCMVDILLKLRRMPLIFGEVPLILRYDFKKGASKMRVMRTAKNTLRLLLLRRIGK
jgi:dolichol-phosphate mannosyltransferase